MNSPNAEFLLDASALLAVMLLEPGYENVKAVMERCVIHAVNAAEVVSRLSREGVPKSEAVEAIEELGLEVIESLTLQMAADTGDLIARTRKLGLSLGDCICMTVAAHMGLTALTAERAWKDVDGRRVAGTAVKVRVIR